MFAFCLDDSGKKSEIKITSPVLVEVIKEIVPLSFFESTPDSVTFQEPYAHLFQYSKDIHKALESRISPHSDQFRDFRTLISFLESHARYGIIWKSLDRDNQRVVSFENLWAVFRVGEPVAVQDRLEEKRLFKFTRLEDSIGDMGHQKDFCVAVEVHFWYIVWSPGKKRFCQKSQYSKIPRFAGHRKVTSLPIYPLRYEDQATREPLLMKLQARGRKWADLISKPPTCFEYSGHAISEDEDGRLTQNLTHLEGRIILDQKDTMSISGLIEDIEFHNSSGEVDEKLNDSWNTSQASKLSSPEHFQLCPPQISCYHVSSGKRYVVSVTNLQPARWSETAINQLILDNDKKDMLTSIVSNQNNNQIKSGDIIENKGRGLTIVLHGPSGVGKTLTAECIAEHAKRPLIPLSVGDLVAMEDSIEDRLTEAFANASRLGAILLLDEADVVLEARSFEDVRRNGIVSVFLRQLEYYSGILVLTTNRINSMDPAFQSRIQVAIAYSELSTKQREGIWGSLLNSNLIDSTESDKAIIEDHIPQLAQYPLNGRQIRNTLKLSAIMAAADLVSDRKVQMKHIEKALRDALQFQECLEAGKKEMKNRNRVWKPFAPSQGRNYV
ncbi:uncharacterized protein Z519_01269 [Cladophialophora bantiana CBS 173.52]|uniref:AAA+ ATPase domain-containing protein n=1 Tax=Cladophialophora bantiana (strain ATCC 10958 / CBS 173.52 / CDC B-1940 / NIH 8579) TaxID=1442370 RepID=A0A0D2I3A4_CLAB1|nr:uncharacterized protein Z519_01269 [Cladophialophora bantiana CBS 173.52]KIW97685.1 hypothetical protein Z519_01269 [Cladophialophora bantiana CBS 173.52]